MKRSIPALLGLLLVMMCSTSAQEPKADPFGIQSVPKFDFTPRQLGSGNFSRAEGAVQTIPAKSEPTLHSNPSLPAKKAATPLIVGRYQLVSHEGRLIMLDTATGECYTRKNHIWESYAPPIDANAPVPAPQL